MGINAAAGCKRSNRQKDSYGKFMFRYIPEWDTYICPERKYLEYRTTNREGYREYKAREEHCSCCPAGGKLHLRASFPVFSLLFFLNLWLLKNTI